MKLLNYTLLLLLFFVVVPVSSQNDVEADQQATDWETVSLGKLQKKPVFKEPMIAVRFVYEDGNQYMHLSLKYMFTDAVFDEAVPVEYYKNQAMEVATNQGKYELKAVKYAKARRMNYVAQKTADIKILFSGSLDFLKDKQVKEFTVHYAQGYQNISINKEEAAVLQNAYNKFLKAFVPQKKAETKSSKPSASGKKPKPVVEEQGGQEEPQSEKVNNKGATLDDLRKQAKRWGR